MFVLIPFLQSKYCSVSPPNWKLCHDEISLGLGKPQKKLFFLVVGPLRGEGEVKAGPLRKKKIF